jgi:hypothetical protein
MEVCGERRPEEEVKMLERGAVLGEGRGMYEGRTKGEKEGS